MKRTKYLVYLMLVCLPAYSTILTRNTFETYEGQTPQQCGWSTNSGGDGLINIDIEDPNNDYQTQSHGEYCLHIYDPNNNSFANAYKSFSNSSSEYMIEFYLWIYYSHATIDSFPLCVLWNMPGEGLPEKTDVSLFLHESGDSFLVYLEDSAGIQQDVATIDSTDRWYKIQIYRYVSSGDTVVTFYLDGDSIDTYVPMNKDKVSNKISLGTTQADSLADGEVFYDDFIVVDYTDRKNKITAIKDTNQMEMLAFLSEANDYFSRIQPYLIYRNHRYFTPGDIYYVVSLSNLLNTTFEKLSNYKKLSYLDELVIKIDQIKLGLLYGDLNETERNIVENSLKFVIDTEGNSNYSLTVKGRKR